MIGGRHDVEIAGLPEVVVGQLEDLAGRLLDYDWVGVGRRDGEKGGEFLPVFYRSSRFEAMDSGTFWISETPGVPGSKSWDSAMPRIVTWVACDFG